MEKLLASMISKLQAYKVLPNSEYRAVGEHLLPIAIEMQGKIAALEIGIREEYDNKLLKLIGELAQGETMTYFIGDKSIVVTAKYVNL
jgi:hypothetical protein